MGSEITRKNNIMMCRLNKTPAGFNKTMSADFFHGTEKKNAEVWAVHGCVGVRRFGEGDGVRLCRKEKQ